MSLIPTRPPQANKYDLTPEEMDCLTWYCLSGCSKDEAFLRFARPDFNGSKSSGTVKSVVAQFFAMKNVKEYIEAYRTLITEKFSQTQKKQSSESDDKPKGTIEERKARALSKFVEYVLSESEKIGEPADEGEPAVDMKLLMDFANKIGIFDQQEEVEEQPRRYLPTSCLSECRYRAFCENPDNVEDLCKYCKYHQFGEENGIHYDSEHQLSLPADFGTEVAEENKNE